MQIAYGPLMKPVSITPMRRDRDTEYMKLLSGTMFNEADVGCP